MERTNFDTQSFICPSCGAVMELHEDREEAVCPFCGHTKPIGHEAAEYLQEKTQHWGRARGWLIAFCVFAVLCMINVLIPDSPLRQLIFPRNVNPFIGVNVKFYGMSGEGRAELHVSNRVNAEYADETRYEITPETGLSNGDVVTVKAKAPLGWRFEPSEKEFTVDGLTVWVLNSNQLRGDNLVGIHDNTEQLIREDWEDIVPSSFASDMTYAPYRMYLFVSDEENAYYRNVLYDTYEVKVTRADGSVFTSYEACRYTDLKIPADGVLTANYGNLQGFNFGYNHGFSYAQAFSGWISAGSMEGDLRYYCDGYHLAD